MRLHLPYPLGNEIIVDTVRAAMKRQTRCQNRIGAGREEQAIGPKVFKADAFASDGREHGVETLGSQHLPGQQMVTLHVLAIAWHIGPIDCAKGQPPPNGDMQDLRLISECD